MPDELIEADQTSMQMSDPDSVIVVSKESKTKSDKSRKEKHHKYAKAWFSSVISSSRLKLASHSFQA